MDFAPIFNPKDYDIKLEDNNETKDKIEELPLKKAKTNKSDHRRHQNNQEDFVTSILDQDNDNVIDFFENVDPMLAWALLKSKILPQVGMFDLLAERSKLKVQSSNEPVDVVKMLLDQLDSLVTEVITMLQNCCETFDHHSQSQDHHQLVNSIQLNPSLSLRK